MVYMRRRAFVTLLGGAAAAWPLAARAQQSAMPVIGFLHGASADAFESFVSAFHQGLKETGFVEGQNVTIQYCWAEGHYDRLPALVADLIGRPVHLIVTAGGDNSAVVAKAATTTIPIVFVVGSDPTKSHLVTRLNRPSGNATGVSIFSTEIAPKQLDLLRELVPQAAKVGMIVNPNNPNSETQIRGAQEAARARGLDLRVVNVGGERELASAFSTLIEQHVDALIVGADGLFTSQRYQLVGLAARHALPAMYFQRDFVVAGGLASYGTNIASAYRQAGIYAGSILKGTSLANLPVLLPTKFDLVVNLQTAKALGRELPPTLLALADEVIE